MDTILQYLKSHPGIGSVFSHIQPKTVGDEGVPSKLPSRLSPFSLVI